MISTGTIVIGIAIFIITYLAIAFESKIKIDKTASAIGGAILMLLLVLNKIVPLGTHKGPELSAWNKHADFDVIFLLAGMMIIVNVMRESGVFQYVAIKCAKMGKGYPLPVLALLLVATAILSAFLDNVTTVLLMAPVTLLVAAEMRLDPIPFLIPEILASNLGGTATLIGDPPNILVGATASKLFAYTKAEGFTGDVVSFDFATFMRVLTPVVILTMAVFIGILMLKLKGGEMKVTAEERARIMDLDEKATISDWGLMWTGLSIMALTLAGFMLHSVLHVEPGVVAMGGAALMLIITRQDVEEALAKVEWNTLFFFIGLFIVVKGASEIGLLKTLGDQLAAVVGHPESIAYVAPLVVLWVSGILAGLMNNVSYTLAALPIVHALAFSFYGGDPSGVVPVAAAPMYWALALGACFGGNLTPVGAAANLVVINIAAKSNKKISWSSYLKWGVPCALGSLILASGYICLYVYLQQN